jgi:hypothetical protein
MIFADIIIACCEIAESREKQKIHEMSSMPLVLKMPKNLDFTFPLV